MSGSNSVFYYIGFRYLLMLVICLPISTTISSTHAQLTSQPEISPGWKKYLPQLPAAVIRAQPEKLILNTELDILRDFTFLGFTPISPLAVKDIVIVVELNLTRSEPEFLKQRRDLNYFSYQTSSARCPRCEGSD